jgi:hypothetical protein
MAKAAIRRSGKRKEFLFVTYVTSPFFEVRTIGSGPETNRSEDWCDKDRSGILKYRTLRPGESYYQRS